MGTAKEVVVMQAADVITSEVITVGEDVLVREVANLMAEHGISAVRWSTAAIA